uniref:HTH araC/xylS-type domain-containing protein n=1 Tax=uncultured Armatimonadetes bacterium TaxID=157466 RepID=A0A6J4HXG2_9BACT|nr:hypothetical protein AVDCRST_MAG63-1272 [uncultured Armatimonadetes bacterium]
METRVLFRNDVGTPLGRLTLAGSIRNGQGVVPAHPLRVYGSYAVMYLWEGSGRYEDASGRRRTVRAGDLVVVFPELAHSYGPRAAGERWSELYIVFDGPVFDLWRQTGLLDSAQPVHRLEPVEEWLGKLKAIAEAPRPTTAAERLRELCRFQGLLAEALGVHPAREAEPGEMRWLARARGLLETDLSLEIDLSDVAAEVDLSYENFRKRFQQQVGVSPARYRATKRIEAARDLLRYTQMTNRQVAESLGFSDEFHFSKRFKQIAGTTPRAFRQRLAGTEEATRTI